MKKKFLLILYTLFLSQIAQSQSFPSPNVAAIGTFGQYPSIPCTGVPSINIPIYNFSYGGLSLPIYLSYNTNSVKPFNAPAWVGLGWNLTAGGAITRVIVDKPDDADWWYAGDYYRTHDLTIGYYHDSHNYLNTDDWASNARIESAIMDMNNYSYPEKNGNDYMSTINDYSPDEFSFSIGDISGKFFLSEDGQWKVRSKDEIKVEIDQSDFEETAGGNYEINGHFYDMPPIKYLTKITLIDSRGIRYVFGGAPNAQEKWDCWYISKIILPSEKTISFTYEAGGSGLIQYYAYYNAEWNGEGIGPWNEFKNPCYLKKIETDLQEITLFRSQLNFTFARLDYLTITSKLTNETIQKTLFEYDADRRKLISTFHQNSESEILQKHTFLYDVNKFPKFSSLLNSGNGIDHWGYFNRKVINGSTSYAQFYTKMEPDTAVCRTELLTQIKYPTGGYTNYTWEPHDYSKEVAEERHKNLIIHTQNKSAGGVRIKQITNFDGNNIPQGFKKYSYKSSLDANKSSGVLYQKPRYLYFASLTFPMSSIIPLSESAVGSHVSYSEVTETNIDGSYVITSFSNFDNGNEGEYMDEKPVGNTHGSNRNSPFNSPSYSSNSHERGYPLRERVFSSPSSMVKDKIFEYDRKNKNTEFVKSYIGVFGEGSRTTYYAWSGSAIKIYTNAYLLKKETETIYDVNGLNPVTTLTNFSYNNNKQLIEKTFTTSKGETKRINYYYPYDFTTGKPRNQLSLNVPNPYDEMVSRHILAPVIEQEEYKLTGNEWSKLSSSRTHYQLWGNNQFLPASKTQRIADGYPEIQIKYHSYDSHGNLTSVSKGGNDPRTSYIYGYKGNYLIAEVTNAWDSEIYHENFEAGSNFDTTLLYDTSKSFTGRMSGKLELYHNSRYSEGPWFQINLTSPKKFIMSGWVYSYAGSSGWDLGSIALIMKKDDNANVYADYYESKGTQINGRWVYIEKEIEIPADVKKMRFRVDGSSYNTTWFDDLRLHPADAQMTTYTYLPLTGITSITDAKGKNTFYEYDSFQRLKVIRDQQGMIIKSFDYHYKP